MAFIFPFHMDVSLVIRYLGGNYIVAQQEMEDIIKRILPYVDKALYYISTESWKTGCQNIF